MLAFPEFQLKATLKFLALTILMAGAASCATAPKKPAAGTPSPHYKVGNAYKIDGRWYYPKYDPNYSKVGIASWYGSQFHGRMTANGEIFDMNRLSAAHTTLPLPSMVEVTNLENGRSITVRVNDRGPFVGDRIIDMSREAARQLGFEQQGIAKVRVRYAGPAHLTANAPKAVTKPDDVARAAPISRKERPTSTFNADAAEDPISDLMTSIERAPALTPGAEEVAIAEASDNAEANIPSADLSTPEPSDSRLVPLSRQENSPVETLYVIRVAALSQLDNIEVLRLQLADVGTLRMSRVETEGGSVFYRVNLGPFASIETAAEKLEAVRRAGYTDAALVTLTP